ncbi:TonB-dependent receptor [Shewanella sp. WXL01]|uniref:TonB-dependent receptor n=1 Tax=Shewanella maritima TaxID=2520507 RepID=A0A411PI46_9GAMM|nr:MULTISPECIES: TonB-dependent receptor [Shewanella]NKF52071.1 TonB-dependent receptor [Shewanella sp. WXL01]QBF83134.1 TonB-dependent receptor [Shewanella maritima]
MKYYSLVVALTLACLVAVPNAKANDDQQGYQPAVALLFDYVNTPSKMYGVTLAPRHYDRDYADWGYYIGYAKGQKTDLELQEPSEGYIQEYMWRFGVSYSMTEDFSIYFGATNYVYETNTTNNIVPLIEGGEPVWERSNDRYWGAEAGLRYRIANSFMIGAGYDTRTESAVISFGFTM